MIQAWHRCLGMVRHQPAWYRARLQEELAERRLAKRGTLHHLSETADVIYASTRARADCGSSVASVPR